MARRRLLIDDLEAAATGHGLFRRQPLDHVAQEYHAKGDVGTAHELVRRLPLRHKAAVLPGSFSRRGAVT